MITLAEVLAEAAGGRPPAPDTGPTIIRQAAQRDAGVIAFTAHNVIFTDLEPDWILAHLDQDDLSAPLNPPFLTALERKTAQRVNNIDLLTLARPLNGSPPLELTKTNTDHPRLKTAQQYRDDIHTWTCPGGLVVLGRGVAGRWEVAIEVAQDHRGRGLGRALARAARHLTTEPLWAQIAPGNAASVRAFLAAGYTPIGAEALLVPREPLHEAL